MGPEAPIFPEGKAFCQDFVLKSWLTQYTRTTSTYYYYA